MVKYKCFTDEVGMDKDFICEMLDCYEMLLTENQRQVMNDYYRFDVSLSEIAEITHISKQAVKDTRDKAINNLESFERALGLARKKREWYALRRDVKDKVFIDFVDEIFTNEDQKE